jgi:GNAT superfamily N-acetyltransferase
MIDASTLISRLRRALPEALTTGSRSVEVVAMDRDETSDAAGAPIRPSPDGSDLRKVTSRDLDQVVKALAQSFYDDPIFSWIAPDDARRLRELERGFDLFARRVWLPQDEAYTTDHLIGAAFWMSPDNWHLSVPAQLRLLPSMAIITRRDLPRLMRVLNMIEAKHPRDTHYYLPIVGIAPQWQGRGFGSAILRPILERCDRDRIPAYLEASSPRNRALYERHDFAVVEEIRVKDSPPIWRMWRDPQRVSP